MGLGVICCVVGQQVVGPARLVGLHGAIHWLTQFPGKQKRFMIRLIAMPLPLPAAPARWAPSAFNFGQRAA